MPPTITTQPANQTVTAGQTATFTAAAIAVSVNLGITRTIEQVSEGEEVAHAHGRPI